MAVYNKQLRLITSVINTLNEPLTNAEYLTSDQLYVVIIHGLCFSDRRTEVMACAPTNHTN